MAKPTVKRNKAAARSCVILGTVLAGTAIWFSVTNAARPVSQNSSAALNGVSSAAASTLNTGNVITSQSAVTSSAPQQPQITPILRTRGS
jgi:hypothetical protein